MQLLLFLNNQIGKVVLSLISITGVSSHLITTNNAVMFLVPSPEPPYLSPMSIQIYVIKL